VFAVAADGDGACFSKILDSLTAPCLVYNTAMYTVYSRCRQYGRCICSYTGRCDRCGRCVVYMDPCSLLDFVVSAGTTNTFKNRLDKFWSDQDILYDYKADLHGIGNRSIVY